MPPKKELTPEQIAERTPRSQLATDNPIFKFKRKTKVLYKAGPSFLTEEVPAGLEVRISGCELNEETMMTNVYLDGRWVVAMNVDLDHVEEELGKKQV